MYPKDSLQWYIEPWWVKDSGTDLKRGRLIKAYAPHVDQIPYELNPVGRTEATVHDKAYFELDVLRIDQIKNSPQLPVAAIPQYEGERRAVYRVKKRPLIVISTGGDEIPKNLRLGKAKWQTSPTILAAPFYGIKMTDKRAGFDAKFVKRIRCCEYSQYFWDILPIVDGEESILRLDHMQPIGKHHDSISITEYSLTKEALSLFDEWIQWLLSGQLSNNSILSDIRQELLKETLV